MKYLNCESVKGGDGLLDEVNIAPCVVVVDKQLIYVVYVCLIELGAQHVLGQQIIILLIGLNVQLIEEIVSSLTLLVRLYSIYKIA